MRNAMTTYKPGDSHKLAVSAAHAEAQLTDVHTEVVRLLSDTNCFVVFGAAPVALADGTHMRLVAGLPEYFSIDVSGSGGAAQKISVIRETADGNLFITEMTQ